MAKRVSSRNTKAEILSAFKELNKEKSNLETELQQLHEDKADKTNGKVVSPPLVRIDKPENKQADNAQKGIDKTINSLELIQIGFGGAASNLSEQLIAEASSLEKLQATVEQEKEQLQELHEIEVVTEESFEELIEVYETDSKQNREELAESSQEQENQWREREEAIATQEKRYGEVELEVKNHQEELEKTIRNGKEKGRNIGNYQGRIKSDLRNKEIEGERHNYQLRVQALEETIENQAGRLVSLGKQLDAALKQVQDLAVKAIEGTSNRNSFEAMKEIAIEQAKNPQKGK
ncbi:MAG: hypothetical protein WA865_01735 [Spirulinaceae cyanobacterium]